LEDTVQLISDDDSDHEEKENSRPIKVRLPSGQEPISLSDDSDEDFCRSIRTPRSIKRNKFRSKTGSTGSDQLFRSPGGPLTPITSRNHLTPKTGKDSSPGAILLRKQLRKDFSPSIKAKVKEDKKKQEEINKKKVREEREKLRNERKERQRLPSNTLCGIHDCIFAKCDDYEAKNYVNNADFLILQLYELINRTIFKSKLPSGMRKKGTTFSTVCGRASISWNNKLRNTAGRCRMAIERLKSSDVTINSKRKFMIELAPHILDRGQRLRDTLLHEMIHAANWIIDENAKAGHGPQFKYWAQIASKIHPEIPRVTTTHSYEINYKYWWECERVSTGWCNVKIGRKSNSLDVNRVRCAICKGKFIYVRFKYYKK